jgi:hypothetical protein
MFTRSDKPNIREMMNYKKDDLQESFNNLIKFIPILDDEDPMTYAILLNLKKDLKDDERELIIHLMQQKAEEEYEKNKLLLDKFNLDNNNDCRK